MNSPVQIMHHFAVAGYESDVSDSEVYESDVCDSEVYESDTDMDNNDA